MALITRRRFLVAGALLAGGTATGLVVGFGYLRSIDTRGLRSAVDADGTVLLNAWVAIRESGTIVLSVPRTEMGQGVHTSLPMLIAEELAIGLEDPGVVVEHPVADLPAHTNFMLALGKPRNEIHGSLGWVAVKVTAAFRMTATGGSSSVVDAYDSCRLAGAAARMLLVGAAAERWHVGDSECEARSGRVVHAGSGRSLAYSEVAASASRRTLSDEPALKPASAFRLIGTSAPRVDLPDKTRGATVYGIDVVLPGMVHATVVHCPTAGARVRSFDVAEARAVPGFIKAVDLGDAVGIIAEGYWEAAKAARAVRITEEGVHDAGLSSSGIRTRLLSSLTSDNLHFVRQEGDVDAAFGKGGALVESTYEVPYLAHGCMEPMNTTALLKDGTLEFWSGTQWPSGIAAAARKAVPAAERVLVHVMPTGGGFGRRLEVDVQVQAARLAAAMPGRPVKVIWSRAEDIRHDFYRPAAVARLRGALGADGAVTALEARVALQSVTLQYTRRNFPMEFGGPDDTQNFDGLDNMIYAIPNVRVGGAAIDLPVPVGYWRSVGTSQNAFFLESFVDELATVAGADPFAFRMRLLPGDDRMAHVASVLMDRSDWRQALGKGRGRGVALHMSRRSRIGVVAQVSLSGGTAMRIERIVCVIDCGIVVNPDTVRAQVEGGIVFGMSAAVNGEITLAGGQVEQSNFHDYPLPGLRDCPDIEVHLLRNDHPPGGVGEIAVPPVAPALANALFAAGAARVRVLPFAKSGFSLA